MGLLYDLLKDFRRVNKLRYWKYPYSAQKLSWSKTAEKRLYRKRVNSCFVSSCCLFLYHTCTGCLQVVSSHPRASRMPIFDSFMTHFPFKYSLIIGGNCKKYHFPMLIQDPAYEVLSIKHLMQLYCYNSTVMCKGDKQERDCYHNLNKLTCITKRWSTSNFFWTSQQGSA